jgi:arylsulfatase A-like enzyme
LTIDALRKDSLGCYGGGNLTPFIDSIQKNCILFTQAYSTGPYTRAAFPGILTSSHYLEFGLQKMLSSRRKLISDVLKSAGITTAAFHSNPHLSGYFGWNRGWDVFYDSMEEEVTDHIPYIEAQILNQKVAAWLSSLTGKGYEKPFFLWVHYMDIHEPYIPQRKYVERVDPFLLLNEEEMFRLFKEVLLKRDVSHKETVALLKKLYQAHVLQIDEEVKKIYEILDARGILQETIIILTSDHGDEFGEHGGLSHDGKMYEELVHVPLLIFDPERNTSQVSSSLVSTLDIAPTIVSLFGLPPVESFFGIPIFPLKPDSGRGIFGEALDKRGSNEQGTEKEIHFYRQENFKIIYREKDDSWKLYDLSADPGETVELNSTSAMAEKMKEKIRLRLKRYEKKI